MCILGNIIDAINNLVNNPILELKDFYKSKNRANNMGDALEEYIKDLFANTLNVEDEQQIYKKFLIHFHIWEIKIIHQI